MSMREPSAFPAETPSRLRDTTSNTIFTSAQHPIAEFFRHVAFRNYLRAHPRGAEDYARLKRSLAGKFSVDRETYTHAKTDFIQEILRRADLDSTEHSPRATRTIS